MYRKLKGRLGNNLKGFSTRSLEKLQKPKLMKMEIRVQVKARRTMKYMGTLMEQIQRIHMKLHPKHVQGVGSLSFGLLAEEFLILLGYKDVPYYDLA